MCGIGGIASWSDRDDSKTVKKMTDLFVHRGPDDFGIRQLKGACLGHRRLSIIDLTKDGHQPMPDNSKRYWIVFNGEIYGFMALRKELENIGISFISNSDTEVLIEGFKVWGIDKLCEKINGMFAFAIWDNRDELLYLARDRFGEKPLYYLKDGKNIRFSSFSKSLYVDASFSPQLDPDGVVSFLHQGFCSHSTPILKDLKTITPGTYTVFSKTGKESKKYWEIDFTKENRSIDEWSKVVESTLEDIIKEELVSDVSTGALLSGGVDSSLIASIASSINPDINLFTVKMNDPRYDESPIAKSFAHSIKGKHHIIDADPIKLSEFQNLLGQFSEPLGDSSAVAMWIVSKAAKKHTTVVLTGDGGDEFFAGYNSIKLAIETEPYRGFLNNFLGKNLYSAADQLFKRSPQSPYLRKSKTFLKLVSRTAKKNHIEGSLFPDIYSNKIIGKELKKGFQERNYVRELEMIYDNISMENEYEKLMLLDIKNTLLNDFIPKVDVASMYHSLEARSPLLHHKLAELSFKMPLEIKRYNNTSKGVLKKILVDRIGKEKTNNIIKGKRGFVIPIDSWFDKEWQEVVQGLPNSRLVKEGWLDEKGVKSLLKVYHQNPSVYSRLRYNLIALDTWYNNNWAN